MTDNVGSNATSQRNANFQWVQIINVNAHSTLLSVCQFYSISATLESSKPHRAIVPHSNQYIS